MKNLQLICPVSDNWRSGVSSVLFYIFKERKKKLFFIQQTKKKWKCNSKKKKNENENENESLREINSQIDHFSNKINKGNEINKL